MLTRGWPVWRCWHNKLVEVHVVVIELNCFCPCGSADNEISTRIYIRRHILLTDQMQWRNSVEAADYSSKSSGTRCYFFLESTWARASKFEAQNEHLMRPCDNKNL